MSLYRSTPNWFKFLYSALLSVVTALVLICPAAAQNSSSTEEQTGSIAGTVLDPNGDAIPGASIIVQGPMPHDTYNGRASNSGFFELRNLKSEVPLRVTIHAHGFADWTSPPIVLKGGQYKLLTECTLQLAEVQTTVNVGYSSAQVATEQVAAQERQRVLGIIPNFYANYDPHPEPMTAKLSSRLR